MNTVPCHYLLNVHNIVVFNCQICNVCLHGHKSFGIWMAHCDCLECHKYLRLLFGDVLSIFVFCHFLCICICHCLCFCHCHCLFVGQVLFPHHSDQMSQRLQVSRVGILMCLLNIFVSVSKLLSMVFFKNQLNSDKVTQTMEQCYEKTLKMEADFSRIAMKQDISPWWSS